MQYTSPIKEYGAVRIRRAETKIKTSDSVWKIQEQFKETSEVSSTLHREQRAETQLSLFSNVSTYGIDPDEFEQFSWTAGRSHGSWETRANKTYGKRYSTKMTEEVNEGGIKIGTFPVNGESLSVDTPEQLEQARSCLLYTSPSPRDS